MNIETEFSNIINKNRYFRNFKRDKKLIVSIILICFSWSIIYLLLFYKPKYESEAKVWIKNLATEEFVTSLDTQNQLTPLTTTGNPLLTQIELLKSEQLKQAIVDFKEKQGEKIKINNVEIDVKNRPGTDILTVDYSDNSAEKAQQTLNEVLIEYEKINLSINKKIRTSRREYIDLKLTDIEQKLKDVRKQLKEYRIKNLSINLDEESIQLVDQQILMSTKLEDTIAEIKNTNSSIKELEKQLSLKSRDAINAVALGSDNQNLVKLRDELNEAVQEYEFDSAKYTDLNPKMIAQKAKIDTINKQIKKQIELSIGKYAKSQKINIFDPVREELVKQLAEGQTNLMGLKAQENSINQSIKKINLEQAKLPEEKYTLDTLEQEEQVLSEAYDQLKQKQIEAKIKEAEAVSNVIVVDTPDLPLDPSFPNAFHTLIIGLILGLFAGMGLSALKTLLEDVCDNTEAIEEITGTSVVGTIPWSETLLTDEQMQFIHGLAYDNIVSNLLIKCYKNNKKVLAFTSSSLKKTQSRIIYQIASRLKKSGHSVVIVDSDLRIPTLLKTASVKENVVNLSDLIVSLEKKIHEIQNSENKNPNYQELIMKKEVMDALVTDELGINHMGNKDMIIEPYEFFGTAAFEYIINVLKSNFDWVLVDTGVAHITPEFLIISKLADGVVLFVSRTITYTTLRTIIKSLKISNIPFIGSIVRESDSTLKMEYEKFLRFQQDRLVNEEGDDTIEKTPCDTEESDKDDNQSED